MKTPRAFNRGNFFITSSPISRLVTFKNITSLRSSPNLQSSILDFSWGKVRSNRHVLKGRMTRSTNDGMGFMASAEHQAILFPLLQRSDLYQEARSTGSEGHGRRSKVKCSRIREELRLQFTWDWENSWIWMDELINVINIFPKSFERGVFFPPILAIKHLDWLLARLTLMTGSQVTNCRFCYISFAAIQLNFIHRHFHSEGGPALEGKLSRSPFENPRFDSLPNRH